MESSFLVGDWLVEPHRNQIVRGGERVRLDPRVMQVLVCLAEGAGVVVPQERLLERVWTGAFVTDGVLTNAIWELRKALGDDSAHPRFIQTVPKKGYRLVAEVRVPGPSRLVLRPWIVGGAAMIVAAVGVGLYPRSSPKPPTSSAPARFVLTLPENQKLDDIGRPLFAISPNGSRLVYSAAEPGQRERLYLRALDEFEAAPLPGTDGASDPFFSPDGEWVGFFMGGKFRKVPVSGGAPTPVVDAREGFGAAWGDDDTIVFQESRLSGLYQVSSSGGVPEVILPVDDSVGACFYPQFLPGRRAILFTVNPPKDGAREVAPHVEVLSLDTGERKSLVEGQLVGYAPTGHLIYTQRDSGSLLAIAFDEEGLEIQGKPTVVLKGVALPFVGAQAAFSRNGTLVYLPGPGQEAKGASLVLLDHDGRARLLTDARRYYDDPRFAPDGRRMAFASEGDIWTLDLESGRTNRLTFHQKSRLPVWSPTGDHILFRTWEPPEGLFVVAADGGGQEELLFSGPGELLPGSWSPDGTIVFEWDTKEGQLFHVLSRNGPREAKPLPISGFGPKLSPDGRFVAYVSGTPREVYVQRFPDGPGKWQVSSGGGTNPVWSPNGREIFYQEAPQFTRWLVAPVDTDPAFSADPPRPLFEYPDLQGSGLVGFPNYDVSPDGRTFVVVKRPPPATEFNVVLNWFNELSRLSPR